MPNYHGYESTTTEHFAAQCGADVLRRRRQVQRSPTTRRSPTCLEWQKQLVDTLGGFDKLEKYRATFGDEFGAKNPFMTGQVAMRIDGEWRAGMIDDAEVEFDYGVAPFPVPDDQADRTARATSPARSSGIAQHQQEAERRLGVREVPDHRHRRGRELRQRDPQRARRRTRRWRRPKLDQDPTLPDVPQDRAEPEQQHDPGQPQRRRLPARPCRTSATPTSPARRPTCRPGLDDGGKQIDTDIAQAQ